MSKAYWPENNEKERWEALWFPAIGSIVVAIIVALFIGVVIGISSLHIGEWPISIKVCLIGWSSLSVILGAGAWFWFRNRFRK